MALPVGVLEALAVQGRPAGGPTEHEPARAAVARRPHQVPDPLIAEHGVVDVERHHLHVVRRVRRAGGDERGDGARLGDSLLQDLPVLVLLVEHQLL